MRCCRNAINRRYRAAYGGNNGDDRKREFDLMKRDAVILNVGRGAVINEAAMIDSLQTGRIRGAVLDVFDVEPLPPDNPCGRSTTCFCPPTAPIMSRTGWKMRWSFS